MLPSLTPAAATGEPFRIQWDRAPMCDLLSGTSCSMCHYGRQLAGNPMAYGVIRQHQCAAHAACCRGGDAACVVPAGGATAPTGADAALAVAWCPSITSALLAVACSDATVQVDACLHVLASRRVALPLVVLTALLREQPASAAACQDDGCGQLNLRLTSLHTSTPLARWWPQSFS